MTDRVSLSEASPPKVMPAADAIDHEKSRSLSLVADSSAGSCVQEWNGSDWVVVDATGCAEGFTLPVLDPTRVQGTYLGERVVTACVRE